MPLEDPFRLLIENPLIIMGIGGLLVLLALQKAECLLGVYCASYFLLNSVRLWSVSLLLLIFMLMLFRGSLSVWRNEVSLFSLLSDSINITIFIFVIILVLSLFAVSTDFSYGKITFDTFCYFSLLPYVLLQVIAPTFKNLKGFMYSFVVVCLVTAILSLFSHDFSSPDYRMSLIVNAITFSTPLAMSCFFLSYFFLETRNYLYKIFSFIVFLLIILTIAFSGTRQNLFPVFPAIALFVYLRSRGRNPIYYVLLICVATVVYYFVDIIGIAALADRYSLTLSDPLGAMEPRIFYYEMAIRDFLSSPIIGNGLGAFGEYLPNTQYPVKDHAHNLFLEILAEEGLIGFTVYGLFLYQVYHRGIQIVKVRSTDLRSLGLAFFCMFLFAIIENMFSGGMDSAGNILWSASGLIIIHRNISGAASNLSF